MLLVLLAHARQPRHVLDRVLESVLVCQVTSQPLPAGSTRLVGVMRELVAVGLRRLVERQVQAQPERDAHDVLVRAWARARARARLRFRTRARVRVRVRVLGFGFGFRVRVRGCA